MTVTATEVYLLDVARGEPVAAELLDAITEEQLADWEGEWVPELLRAMQRLRRAGVERRLWPQSRHWDWRRKVWPRCRGCWPTRASASYARG